MTSPRSVLHRACVAPCLAIVAIVATPQQVRPKPYRIAEASPTAHVKVGTTTIPAEDAGQRVGDTSATDSTSATTTADDAVDALARKDLRLPVDGADVHAMKGQFGEAREGGARGHEAVDILAPRNTPVHAVDDGTIAKLFLSKPGGLTIYEFDPTGRFCYYYAHLERYAPGLAEHQRVSRGDVIGYVGTSGNAPKDTPHLHFAIFELTAARQWWKGTPLDPWKAFSAVADDGARR